MAVNKIRVDTASLDRTRSNLQAKLDRIKKDVERICDDMSRLNSMWSGEAHEAFEVNVANDIQTLRNACDSMQGIIRYEDSAVSEYNKCESQVADLVARIRI